MKNLKEAMWEESMSMVNGFAKWHGQDYEAGFKQAITLFMERAREEAMAIAINNFPDKPQMQIVLLSKLESIAAEVIE